MQQHCDSMTKIQIFSYESSFWSKLVKIYFRKKNETISTFHINDNNNKAATLKDSSTNSSDNYDTIFE